MFCVIAVKQGKMKQPTLNITIQLLSVPKLEAITVNFSLIDNLFMTY